MINKHVDDFLELTDADGNEVYDIKPKDTSINLDLIGEDSPDGVISFYIMGRLGTYTAISGVDIGDGLQKYSITGIDANGAKLEFDVTGYENFKIIVTSATTGTIKGALTILTEGWGA